MTEFITNNILHIGSLFEDPNDDEDVPRHGLPVSQQQQPFQPIQITPGFLYCAQSLMVEEKVGSPAPRVFCLFIDNNYKLDFSSPVFHPPSFPG